MALSWTYPGMVNDEEGVFRKVMEAGLDITSLLGKIDLSGEPRAINDDIIKVLENMGNKENEDT